MYSSIKTNDNFIKGVGVKPKIDEASYSVELPLVNQICFKSNSEEVKFTGLLAFTVVLGLF